MSLARTLALSKQLNLCLIHNNHYFLQQQSQSMKKISTSAILRLSEDVPKKDELIVDYLDGKRAGIVVFGLNRPEAKNSFSKNLVGQLIDAVEAVKFDKGVRVVIIKSTSPGIFCAGADLKERAKMPANMVGAFVAKARNLINDLENLPCPVIAAIGKIIIELLVLWLCAILRIFALNIYVFHLVKSIFCSRIYEIFVSTYLFYFTEFLFS